MTRLRARTVFSDDTLTVTAVEKLALQSDKLNRKCFLIGSLQPVAVIVKTPDRTYTLDLAAQPLDLDQVELPAGLDLE
jgi:dihydrodipicolinate reductase